MQDNYQISLTGLIHVNEPKPTNSLINEYNEDVDVITFDDASYNSTLHEVNGYSIYETDVTSFTTTSIHPVTLSNKLTVVHVKPKSFADKNAGVIKRLFDVIFSVIVMILGLPVFALLYLITKFSSKGPAFFRQERVGKNGRPFYIYKFRSMHVNAEKFGPQLSSQGDPRITKWGRIIRRTRLDELPQFYNVLRGDMAVVGPRPERKHFVDQIVHRNPAYRKLQDIKPGITSMGQVYFGYAENVDQMCIRMTYDLDYLNKYKLSNDIKIIANTVKIMFQLKGK